MVGFSEEEWTKLLNLRHSARDFRPDPIPPELLETVLKDALRAPSWSNPQPYRLAAASDGRRDRISQELVQLFDSALSARDGGLLAKTRILLTRRGMPDGDF